MNFARSLGIPLNPNAAIETLKDMHIKESDIGKINDRYFMICWLIGAIAEATYNVSVEQKPVLGLLPISLKEQKRSLKRLRFL